MSVKTTIEGLVTNMSPAHDFLYERPNKANIDADSLTYPAVIMIESERGRFVVSKPQIQNAKIVTLQFLNKVEDIEDDAETNLIVFDEEEAAAINFIKLLNNNGTFEPIDVYDYDKVRETKYDVGVIGYEITFEATLRVGTSNCV